MEPRSSPSCTSPKRLGHLPGRSVFFISALPLAAGSSEAAGAASAVALINSSAGRQALLQQFSGEQANGLAGGGDVLLRANRRHPDVGYISQDPICWACVLAPVLPPPQPSAAPARPMPAKPKPLASSAKKAFFLQVLAASKPVLAPPPPGQASPLVSLATLEMVQAPAPVMTLMVIEAPFLESITMESPPVQQAPAPFPILGGAMVFTVQRRLRQRIRAVRGGCHQGGDEP